MQSVGIAAALQSLRFIFGHSVAFIRLIGAWAAVYLAVILLFAYLAKPTGYTLGSSSRRETRAVSYWF